MRAEPVPELPHDRDDCHDRLGADRVLRRPQITDEAEAGAETLLVHEGGQQPPPFGWLRIVTRDRDDPRRRVDPIGEWHSCSVADDITLQ